MVAPVALFCSVGYSSTPTAELGSIQDRLLGLKVGLWSITRPPIEAASSAANGKGPRVVILTFVSQPFPHVSRP
jgi:hypothetical protein